jgi:methylenetetrahydrofolate reductase (NADPH)
MNDNFHLSFEFFPPKTDLGRQNLVVVAKELNSFVPEFFSVTYGAGGSTRDTTKHAVQLLLQQGLTVAPHLSFGGDDENTILAMVREYAELGVKRIVALRGDRPSGMEGGVQMVYANELVALIRCHFNDQFHLEVAAYPEIHPEALSFSDDIRYLKGKFDAGANSALTQYFYNPDAYFSFVERCQEAGITQPIVPGIMPITNYKNLARFSDNCGAEIPRWVRKRLAEFGDDLESVKSFGLDLVTELCDTLIDNGAPGLHFYTMNQLEPTTTLIRNLGLDPA